MKITGAIFDMDGTLVDSLFFWNRFWEKLGIKYFDDPEYMPPEYVDKYVRTSMLTEAGDFLHSELKIGENMEELAEFLVSDIADFYRYEVDFKPGARKFLDFCRKKGIKMCVASATSSNILKIASQALGFDEYFEFVMSCDEVGRGKDEPDVYVEALKRLGTEPETTWIFEDSYVALETASKLGISTVGIFDKWNFDHDKLNQKSVFYIDEDETMEKLICEIE